MDVHPRCEGAGAVNEAGDKAPSSLEEGVGGGGPTRQMLLKRAAEMRNNPTEQEWRLWMQLRGSRFAGHKFRRQALIGHRIVDFFNPAKGLVVEVDGDTHDREADVVRDSRMEASFGFRTIRFTNLEVMREMDGCLTMLRQVLDAQADRWPGRHHPPAPSSKEEGEK